MNLLRALEGPGVRRWYVAEQHGSDVTVLAGPFPTRERGRIEVGRIARRRGQPPGWPRVEAFPGYPGFAAVHTDGDTYFVGRASAMCDQGDKWAAAIGAYIARRPPRLDSRPA